MTNEEKLSEIREYIYGSKKPGGGAALALLKDIDQYIDNLEQENAKQKKQVSELVVSIDDLVGIMANQNKILEILKPILNVQFKIDPDTKEIYYFVNEKITRKLNKEKYDILKEWLYQRGQKL